MINNTTFLPSGLSVGCMRVQPVRRHATVFKWETHRKNKKVSSRFDFEKFNNKHKKKNAYVAQRKLFSAY